MRPVISFRCSRARARASAGTDRLAASSEDARRRSGHRRSRTRCRGPCRTGGGDTRAGGCGGWATARAWRPSRRAGRPDRSRSDQTPSLRARKSSSMRSGSPLGSAWSCWFWSRARVCGSRQWLSTIFWMPRIRSSTEMSTLPPNAELPQCIQRSVPSRRSNAGENWKAWSLRIESTRNFRHSRCLTPGDGDDRVVARPCRPCGRGRSTGRRCTARRAWPRRPTAGAGSGTRVGSATTSRRP